jgi:4-diphosphocytidyl-2-C-methyl-D-erythritol kinase
VRVTILKRVPVAGGMGGGSADAAAFLRVAGLVASVGSGAVAVAELGAELGADVPSQLEPGLVVGTGAGEVVQRRAPLAPHAYVVVPLPHFLSAADVYREADRLGLPHDAGSFAGASAALVSTLAPGVVLPERLLVNDLARAAISLCPAIEEALENVGETGADHALVSGSGPTVVGLIWGEDAQGRAGTAASALASRYPGACSAAPVEEEFGIPVRM